MERYVYIKMRVQLITKRTGIAIRYTASFSLLMRLSPDYDYCFCDTQVVVKMKVVVFFAAICIFALVVPQASSRDNGE